jgi:hypothetical protein
MASPDADSIQQESGGNPGAAKQNPAEDSDSETLEAAPIGAVADLVAHMSTAVAPGAV